MGQSGSYLPVSLLDVAPATATYNNNVAVTASSTIDVQGAGVVSLGALTMNPGTTLATTNNSVQFNSTTFTGSGAYALNLMGLSLTAGTMSDGGNTTTVSETGTGVLVLASSSNSLQHTSLIVGGSNRLMLVGAAGGFAVAGRRGDHSQQRRRPATSHFRHDRGNL